MVSRRWWQVRKYLGVPFLTLHSAATVMAINWARSSTVAPTFVRTDHTSGLQQVGTPLYCTDCQVTSPSDNTCTSGGSGSMAFYVNGIWQCSTAGPGPTGITGTLTAGCVPVADSPTDVVCSAASDNGTTFTIAEPVQVGSTGAGFVQPGTTMVGSLPTCNSGALNTQSAVTDALAPTFLNAVTGGGGVFTPVLCNGTDWVATGGGGSPVLVSSLVASGIVDGLAPATATTQTACTLGTASSGCAGAYSSGYSF